jgi:hypothetical protein
LVIAAAASSRPRTNGSDSAAMNHAISAPTSASFVFMLSVYSVNGLAAQPKASSTPIRGERSRQPATNRPAIASRSKAEEATCAAGRSSQRPLQPSAATDGTYDA